MSESRPRVSSNRLSVHDITRRTFRTTRRGYDPHEVRSFLELVAQEIESWEQWAAELQREVAEAEARAQKAIADAEDRLKNPVIDEARLSAALGRQSAQVLRNAHEEAARLVAAAEERATAVVRDAQQQAAEAQVAAEGAAAERIAEAELTAGVLRQNAEEEAASLLEAARQEGEAIMERARDRGRQMIEQAQEARKQLLTEMAQRRRLLLVQVEQVRAARDELIRSVLSVRGSVDAIVEGLARADDDARAAAAQVGARQPAALGSALGEAVVAEGDEVPGVAEASLGDALETELRRAAGPLPESDAATVAEAGIDGLVDPVANVAGGDPGAVPGEQATAGPTRAVSPGGPARAPEQSDLAEAPVQPVDTTAPTGPPAEAQARVEELFARLRAGAAPPTTITATAPSVEGVPERQGAPPGWERSSATDAPDFAMVARTDEELGNEASEQPRSEDAALLASRDELLAPIVSRLARQLKRALQDDQNALLHRLRDGTARDPSTLVVEEEQRDRLREAARASLLEARRAGAQFLSAHLAGKDGDGGPASDPHHGVTRRRRARTSDPDREVEGALHALAGTVVTLLRRRLFGEDGADLESGPQADERVSAAYREWRGERIERLAGDYALGSFSSGLIDSLEEDATIRWVVGGPGTSCADCGDNALAEEVHKGERFPTGHLHPPAHPGCRCMVVPV